MLLNINSLLILPIGYIEYVSFSWSRLFSISAIYFLIMNLSILDERVSKDWLIGCKIVLLRVFLTFLWPFIFFYIKDLTKHPMYINMHSFNAKQVSIKVITWTIGKISNISKIWATMIM